MFHRLCFPVVWRLFFRPKKGRDFGFKRKITEPVAETLQNLAEKRVFGDLLRKNRTFLQKLVHKYPKLLGSSAERRGIQKDWMP